MRLCEHVATRRILVLVVAFVAAAALAATADPSGTGRFTATGTVTYVVDGDTLDVTLTSGGRERVRLIGIDTPERGECYAGKATGTARALAHRRRVVLRGDATQDTRDRYGRLLAYVWIEGRRDLGFQLIRRGLGRVYVYERPFERLGPYRHAERIGRAQPHNVWRGCRTATPTPTAPRGRCDPSYPGVCIPPYPPDLDCADVPYKRFRVVGADPHGFDGDGDGIGCER